MKGHQSLAVFDSVFALRQICHNSKEVYLLLVVLQALLEYAPIDCYVVW